MSDWESPEEITALQYNVNQGNDNYQFGLRNESRGRGRGRGRIMNQSRQFGRIEQRGRSEFEPHMIMEIPSDSVGRVIGRQGSKIQEMESISGAKINITKETNYKTDDIFYTKIRFKGKPEQIERAKELIAEVVAAAPAQLVSESKDVANSVKWSDEVFDKLESEQRFAANSANSVPNVPETENLADLDWDEMVKQCELRTAEHFNSFPPIQKCFYVEHPDIARLSDEDAETVRKASNNISVYRLAPENIPLTNSDEENIKIKAKVAADVAKPIPKPIIDFFHAFHNFPEILDLIDLVGFQKPTPVQMQAWPVLLSGEDMIGIAQTGTGKTLAFLLPALIHIDNQIIPKEDRIGPSVLVMAPTRELALQIEREVNKYNYKNIRSVCLYGGGNRIEQINAIKEGVEIVIATPGRLNDIVSSRFLNPESFTYVVLDEADRMLDMGFEPQIRKVLYSTRPQRQTVMTSATWPVGVRRLKDSYMTNPVQVYVGSLDLTAVHSVSQTVVVMDDDEDIKFNYLIDFAMNLKPSDKTIVFCAKKTRADHICSELCLKGFRAEALHGDREQCDREQALLDIMDGSTTILVATDVASRGIDIEDLTYVVNYDFPRNIEEYVHRVGRTGRAGRMGESVSYFTRADWGHASELIPILEEANQTVPTELYDMAQRYEQWKRRKEAEGRPSFSRGGARRYNHH